MSNHTPKSYFVRATDSVQNGSDGSSVPGSTGFANPMTTPGDLIVGGTAGAAGRVGVGVDGQVWNVASGVPAWGGIVVPAPPGSGAYVLESNAGVLSWGLASSVGGGGGSGGFDPTTFAGLQLWLKADALALSDGDTVGTWIDSSGAGNNGTGSGTPIYKTGIVNSKPVVRFGGSTQHVTTPYLPTGQISVFCVGKWAVLTTNILTMLGSAQVVGGSPSGGFVITNYGSGSPYNTILLQTGLGGTWNDGTSGTGGTLTTNFHLLELVIAAGSTKLYLDTVNIINDATHGAINGVNFLWLGGNPTDQSDYHYLNGDIAEVLCYNSALSDANRASVKGYLIAKYGL